MELHFCSQCGISIPQSEIDSGVASGAGGKHLCSEHREGGDGGAKPPAGRSSSAASAADEEQIELLFCSNCRVSIPATDARSGRARKEYGSLLCAVCAKADPGERAARREAVEAEMQDDVDEDFPVSPRSSPATAPPSVAGSPGSGGGGVGILTLVLFGIVLVGAFAATTVLLKEEPPKVPDLSPEVAAIVTRQDRLESDLEKFSDAVAKSDGVSRKTFDDANGALRAEIGSGVRSVREEVATIRTELGASLSATDRELAEKLANLAGKVDALSAQVDTLLRTTVERPEPPPVKTDDPDPAVKEPAEKAPDPRVTQRAQDLLNSPEDSVRFPAATELGRIGDPAAIPYLAKALTDDKHFLVRRACARSLGLLKAWNAVPHLVEALQDKEAYVAAQANYALLNITGQDFGVTQDQSTNARKSKAKGARKWWEKNKDFPPEGVNLESGEL